MAPFGKGSRLYVGGRRLLTETGLNPLSARRQLCMLNQPLKLDTPDQGVTTCISPSAVGEVTQLLTRWNADDPEDQAQLLKLVYPELKRLAEFHMRGERRDHTLQPTALVNEFVLRLCGHITQPWKDRVHFLAVASRAMRRILVDYARAHRSDKRGGHHSKIQLEGINTPQPHTLCDVLALDESLQQLATEDARMAEVVELRFFGGLSNAEVAEMLGVGERTVQRDWQVARAWLYARLRREKSDAG
jgi:RNA polymerase sigma factor (TIGR02999 family)